jgi:hypothetical protein
MMMAQPLLTDTENEAAGVWHFGHRCKAKSTRVLRLTATPTGIGLSVKVECVACGKSKDVSDYGSW